MFEVQSASFAIIPPQQPKAARSRAIASDIRLSVVRTVAGLEALQQDWDALFASVGRPTQVFQTHAFCAQWARTYLSTRSANAALISGTSLAIIVGSCDGKPVMIWPLIVEVRFGLRLVSWLGTPVAQYGDVVIAPELNSVDVMNRAWAFIRSELSPDVVRLRKVRADAVVAPHLLRFGMREVGRNAAPFVILSSHEAPSFEDRQSAKARKNRRRLMRRLEEQGRVTFERLAGCRKSGERVVTALASKRRWIAARGLYSTAFSDTRIDAFFHAAATDDDQSTGCTVYSLLLDGRPLAVVIGFASGRRMTLHVISYDLDFERSGVGVLALEAVLRDCESRGIATVDLLAPVAQYKLDWADGSIDVVDHSAAMTLCGQVWSGVCEGSLRQHAKSALEGLPKPVRRLIAGYRTAYQS